MRKPIACNLGVFRLSESDWASLAKTHPSYVGQSNSVPHRWETYLRSATDFRKHKNCLDRIKLKGHRVLFRLLDWGLVDKANLDNSERCQIALWKPTLNVITFDFDDSYCQIPLKRSHRLGKVSGIYQLVVVPLSVVRQIPMITIACRDAVKSLEVELKTKPERLKGYVPLEKLRFYEFP